MNKGRLVGGLIAAEIFSMAGYAAFASLLVELSHRWQLDPVQAGWIGSAYLLGYALAVPALVGMTDRIDSRVVYLVGTALSVISGCCFAWLANGFWSAMLFRALGGMGLAGTYMPGLRILTERLKGAARIRSVPYYTAAFGVGASLSFFLSGWMAQHYGWPGAFWASALGAVAAALLMLVASSGIPVERKPNAAANSRHPLDFRPVLTNRDALSYVLAYGGHSWELFGFRAWLPAYLLFAWTRFGGGAPGSAITNWATVITVTSLPASIIGAEFAIRDTRKRLIRWFATSSVVVGLATALCGNFSFALTVLMLFGYAFAVSADSGALTAGAVEAARPGEEGATLAVYSVVGFAGAAIGPLAGGFALDAGGGLRMPGAWHLAFGAIVTGSALAAIAISRSRPR
jgi:MFS family permease